VPAHADRGPTGPEADSDVAGDAGRGSAGGEGRHAAGEPSEKGNTAGRSDSPLLANLYLHWFDKVFHGRRGPARWANAKLVRYADDFVVLARYLTPHLRGWIEAKLETWMGLEINREKTRVVNLKEEGASLDFLGYTFRYDRDLKGGDRRYLNVTPSKKALERERERLRAMTDSTQSHKPLPRLIAELNRHLKGWGNYFSFGYPLAAFGRISSYVQQRLLPFETAQPAAFPTPGGCDLQPALRSYGAAVVDPPSVLTACDGLRL